MNVEEEVLSQIEISRARTMTQTDLNRLIAEAEAFCKKMSLGRQDYRWIVFWQFEVQGLHKGDWSEGYRPGCIALHCDNAAYISVGGNYQDGAERWELIPPR